MDHRPVFYDPVGRRGTFVTRFGALVGTVAAVLSTLCLIIALFTIPYLPAVSKAFKPSALPGMPSRDLHRADFLKSPYRAQLAVEMARERRRLRNAKPVATKSIVAGFYAPWEATGLASLRAHASELTHIVPQWAHLTPDGQGIDLTTDFDPPTIPGNRDVISIARQNGLGIVPILDNSANGKFDTKRMSLLLQSPQAQRAIAFKLANWLDGWQFQGINLDFELVGPQEGQHLLAFLRILRREFDKKHLTISFDLEAEGSLPTKQVADLCDWVVLMAYDQHWEEGPPGPISSIEWADQKVEQILKTVPKEKLVLGIGNYAYDWTEGKTGAENLTFQEALTAASGYRSEKPEKVIQLDDTSLNNSFAYRDENDKRHQVWILDAVSAYNQWKTASDNELRGAALWFLGSEDPGIWTFLDRGHLWDPIPVNSLQNIKFPYEIAFSGRGEILQVKSRPQEGARTLGVDPDTGLITECSYTKYAFPYVIQKTGFVPMKLALTFDDGPDPEWTPQILDVLKQESCPATFFVIGNSCEQHPGLVSKEYAAGHEIGSHSFFHPNMGAISEQRDRLELNLTQMAIESATDRSTILFRPPYNADSEPETAEQVKPIEIASSMQYVTVAENVDPTDWDPKILGGNSVYRRRTPEDIASFVEENLRQRKGRDDEGNVILLHDAGGDRSATVAALKILIPRLRAEGYQFVPVSTLMGTTRDKVMPPIPAKDYLVYLLGKIVLGSTYAILWFLSVAFVLAVGLGLARIVIVTFLAMLYQRREAAIVLSDYLPEVSAVIAAYNEERVIVRTIESVLHSSFPVKEVVVVDDGSSDDTSGAVAAAFASNPKVRVLRQENGGKALALNNGISQASGEILFSIDADTQLAPDALGLLIRHFDDPKVGAVAGNVRVGNEVNVITYWQSLEYTTSQNLDRRAYAGLNAITVVPGAIGAWRKSAVLEVGGYTSDTLAEDMDLTWRLRRAEYRIANEPYAYAYTEAPHTFRAFFRQRFRWAYGTLQCLFKHRGALMRYGWFGRLALPSLWLFQVLFQALAPLVDLEVIISIVSYLLAYFSASGENGSRALAGPTQTILQVGFLYAIFFGLELVAAIIATRMERQRYGLLWWLFLQRFAYRQIMYGVIYRSIVRAVTGGRQGWGKAERQGTVRVPPAG